MILSWWQHCKWFHIVFLSWNAFFWCYTRSYIYRQNRNISSNFDFRHYFFWCWWFWLTNLIWCIGYFLWLDQLFGYELFSSNWSQKFLLCFFFLITRWFWILGCFFVITRYSFSIFGVTESFCIEVFNLLVSNGTANVYTFQYLDLKYPFQKLFYRSAVQE